MEEGLIMSLRFILGRSGYGKTEFCLNEIKQALLLEDDTPLIYLVPEQATLQAEKELIKHTAHRGSIRAQVLSFNRLAYHVFLETGRINRKLLENAGKDMLLRKIVYELKEDLLFFNTVSNKKGFTNMLGNTITEFFKYGITPNDLIYASEQFKQKQVLYFKILDLHKIYELYSQKIQENYLSNDQTLDLLSEQIEKSVKLKGARIWLDGFNTFIPQEYKVIEKLLGKVSQINVAMCTDSFERKGKYDPFSEVKSSIDRILKLSYSTKQDNHVLLDKNHRLNCFPELSFFEERYLSDDSAKYTGEVSNIKIMTASNIYEEAIQTAKSIRRLLMDKKYRYSDIAIVVPSVSDYEKVLKCIMKQFDIKIFVDAKTDIFSHSLTELIRAAIDIVVSNWSYESVFRFLKTDLLYIGRDDIDILENYVLAHGIHGSKWTKEWEYGFDTKYEAFDKQHINDCRKKVLEILQPFTDKLYSKKKMSVKDISKRIFDMIYKANVPSQLEIRINANKNSADAQIWDKIVSVFNKLVEILGDEIVTIGEYAQLVTTGFEKTDMGLIPPTQDQIIIGDFERTRLPEIKALFVLGVNEGAIPAVSADDDIFSDEERIFMSSTDLELAPSNRQKAFYEIFLIYNVLTKPKEYLQLSYTKQPSSVIVKFKEMFHKDIIQRDTDELSAPSYEFGNLTNILRKHENFDEIPELYKQTYKWFYENEYYRERLLRAECYVNQNIIDEKLNESASKELYKGILKTSVSRLEKYAACPFAYFIEYTLCANERKKYKLEDFELGTVLHEIIDIFFKSAQAQGVSVRELSSRDVETIVENNINDLYGNILKPQKEVLFGTARHDFFMKRVANISKHTIWALYEHIKKGKFEPRFNEVEFSTDSEFSPIVLELEDGTQMILSGRIDRADILRIQDGNYVKIIDYKSGSKKIDLEEIYYGKQLQLVLYLDALIQKVSGIIELSPGAILYFKIDNPIIEYKKEDPSDLESEHLKQFKMSGLVLKDKDVILSIDEDIETYSDVVPVVLVNSKENKGEKIVKETDHILEAEQFEILRHYVKEKIKSLGGQIMAGDISINPYKDGDMTGCTYCKYASICQIDVCISDSKYNHFHKLKEDVFIKMQEALKAFRS